MSALSTLVHRFFVRLVGNYVGKYPSTSVSAESLFRGDTYFPLLATCSSVFFVLLESNYVSKC